MHRTIGASVTNRAVQNSLFDLSDFLNYRKFGGGQVFFANYYLQYFRRYGFARQGEFPQNAVLLALVNLSVD